MAPNRHRYRIARTLRRSRTIAGGLLMFAGTLGGIFSDAVSVALDAATQFAALAPVAGLAAALGVETKAAMTGLALAGLALSVFARLHDAHTGANTR
jgi:hypothetical protein